MKIKALIPIVIIGFVLAFTYHFIAIAAIDAPHNESYNVGCGSCHDEGLLQSLSGSENIDGICTQCHKVSSCPYVDTNVLAADTHLDSDENALAECRTCHDPHYQKQKNYKNTDASNLYLAYGTIESFIYNGDGTSTLTYDPVSIMYKTGWDAAKLTGKTDTCRRTILFPNVKKLGYSYPIIAVDTPAVNTITVKGDVTKAYQYIAPPTDFAVLYGQFIRDSIDGSQVKFFDQTGAYSFADGVEPYNGVCEFCHSATKYHRNDGSGDPHHETENCTTDKCHSHNDGFRHCFGGGSGEVTGCHDGPSHSTHTRRNSKGPAMLLMCSDCHDTNDYRYFKSGTGDPPYDLSITNVCDTCHSPGGSYNGVEDDANGSIGAKNHWSNAGVEVGVYSLTPASQIPDWKPNAIYQIDDVIMYLGNVYISLYDFLSGTSPNASRWNLVNPWQSDITYQAGDVVTNIGNVYRCLDECTLGIFEVSEWDFIGPWQKTIQAGKEKWCIGCHDDDPSTPGTNESALIDGVYAPNIAGDELIPSPTYGFYISGHGRTGIEKDCLDCHDIGFIHIDYDSRTYVATSSLPRQSYRYAYRLNEDMAIPRNFESIDIAFKLCMGVCHDAHAGIFSDDKDVQYPADPSDCNTHFRTQGSQYHEDHLIPTVGVASWDSDWNGQVGEGNWNTYLDSSISCPACHNVHGSPSPAMTRHGELISTPTNDKVPAFDFGWYERDKATQTDVLKDSYWVHVNMGNGARDNYVCDICHATNDPSDNGPLPGEYYYRFPGCPEITEMEIWTTDLSDNLKNKFTPGDSIRYHIRVVFTGLEGDEYFMKTVSSGASGSIDPNEGGGTWQTPLSINAYRPIGEHTGSWDRTVPSNAEPGSIATYYMDLFMLDEAGGYPFDRQTEIHNFCIEPCPP